MKFVDYVRTIGRQACMKRNDIPRLPRRPPKPPKEPQPDRLEHILEEHHERLFNDPNHLTDNFILDLIHREKKS